MANIQRQDIDGTTIELTVSIPKGEYQPKVEKKLAQLQKSASIKGFRAGHSPMGLIRAQYGKSVVAEEVFKIADELVYGFIKENDLNTLGQPMHTNGEAFDVNLARPSDYELKFELGHVPAFEIKGIDHVYDRYISETEGFDIDGEIKAILQRNGEMVETDTVQVGDIVYLDLKEKNGEVAYDNAAIKTDKLGPEEFVKTLIGKKVGDAFEMDIFAMNYEATFIKKFILGVTEDTEVSNEFEATIVNVKSMQAPKELTQDMLERTFGPDGPKSEQELRTMMADEQNIALNRQADTQVKNEIFVNILEKAEIQFPAAFLEKWIRHNGTEESNIETELEFTKRSLTWSLIRNKVIEANDIQIQPEELKAFIINGFRRQFGAQIPEYLFDDLYSRVRKDKDQMQKHAENLLDDKVLDVLFLSVKTKDKNVSKEEFDRIHQETMDKSKRFFSPAGE